MSLPTSAEGLRRRASRRWRENRPAIRSGSPCRVAFDAGKNTNTRIGDSSMKRCYVGCAGLILVLAVAAMAAADSPRPTAKSGPWLASYAAARRDRPRLRASRSWRCFRKQLVPLLHPPEQGGPQHGRLHDLGGRQRDPAAIGLSPERAARRARRRNRMLACRRSTRCPAFPPLS